MKERDGGENPMFGLAGFSSIVAIQFFIYIFNKFLEKIKNSKK